MVSFRGRFTAVAREASTCLVPSPESGNASVAAGGATSNSLPGARQASWGGASDYRGIMQPAREDPRPLQIGFFPLLWPSGVAVTRTPAATCFDHGHAPAFQTQQAGACRPFPEEPHGS
jgi:hypothetical protein